MKDEDIVKYWNNLLTLQSMMEDCYDFANRSLLRKPIDKDKYCDDIQHYLGESYGGRASSFEEGSFEELEELLLLNQLENFSALEKLRRCFLETKIPQKHRKAVLSEFERVERIMKEDID